MAERELERAEERAETAEVLVISLSLLSILFNGLYLLYCHHIIA